MQVALPGTKGTYEKLVFIKTIPYWLFWPVIGLLGFLIQIYYTEALGEKHYFLVDLIFFLALGLLPTFYIWLSHGFGKTFRKLVPLLWKDESLFDNWMTIKKERIFTLHTKQAKFTTILFVVISNAVLFSLGLPGKTWVYNALGLLDVLPRLIIVGQGVYIIPGLLLALSEIVRQPAQLPFNMLPHPAISSLQNFYSAGAFLSILAYLCLVVMFWLGPWGLSPLVLVCLSIAGLFPITMLVWSFFQIHVLMASIKFSDLQRISNEVELYLKKFEDQGQADALEKVQKLMDIQTKVKALPEWPIAGVAKITLAATSAIAALQGAISLLQALNIKLF